MQTECCSPLINQNFQLKTAKFSANKGVAVSNVDLREIVHELYNYSAAYQNYSCICRCSAAMPMAAIVSSQCSSLPPALMLLTQLRLSRRTSTYVHKHPTTTGYLI